MTRFYSREHLSLIVEAMIFYKDIKKYLIYAKKLAEAEFCHNTYNGEEVDYEKIKGLRSQLGL